MIRVLLGLTALAVLSGTASAQQADPAAGEQVFKKCVACHAVGPEAKNKVGPVLNGTVGRKWASVEGYNYSADLKQGGEQGKVWDDATLGPYLENPKQVAPKGKMAFAGLRDAAERANVIAYLKQFDASGAKK